MSSTDLSSFRDDVRREDIDLYHALCVDLIIVIKIYVRKSVAISSDLDSGETLEDRTRDAARLLDVLLDAISQELSDVESVQNRFFESFAKAIGVDPDSLDEVKSASIVQLSEDECRTALSIAVKTIADTKKMNQIRSSQADAFLKLSEFRNKQRCEWDKKAGELAQDVNRLNAAAEAREKETRKMASSLKKCSKRLNILVSSAPQTASKGKARVAVVSLEDSVSAAEKLFKAECEKVKMLEGRLADAEKQLDASRGSLVDSTAEIETLRNQLRVATQNGQIHAARAKELEEKLRCSICMDRPKNVAFACGHTCCDQCAYEWKRCPNKCEGAKSHKPVKHTFPLYL